MIRSRTAGAMGRELWLVSLLLGTLTGVVIAAPPNDPFASSQGAWGQDFADQWGLLEQRIYADIAPSEPGEPVIVAVIDTGLDLGHEDLAQEKIWRNPNEQLNGRDDDNNGLIDDVVGWNYVAQNNNPHDDSGQREEA